MTQCKLLNLFLSKKSCFCESQNRTVTKYIYVCVYTVYIYVYTHSPYVSTDLFVLLKCELMTSGLNHILFFSLLLNLASISGTLKLKIHPSENDLKANQFVGWGPSSGERSTEQTTAFPMVPDMYHEPFLQRKSTIHTRAHVHTRTPLPQNILCLHFQS